MKKILTTLAISGLTVAAFAQGTVQWENVANLLIVQTNSSVYSSFGGQNGYTGPAATGFTAGSATTLFYYELLTSATATAVPTTPAGLSAWSDTSLMAQNGGAANGRILQDRKSVV